MGQAPVRACTGYTGLPPPLPPPRPNSNALLICHSLITWPTYPLTGSVTSGCITTYVRFSPAIIIVHHWQLWALTTWFCRRHGETTYTLYLSMQQQTKTKLYLPSKFCWTVDVALLSQDNYSISDTPIHSFQSLDLSELLQTLDSHVHKSASVISKSLIRAVPLYNNSNNEHNGPTLIKLPLTQR